MVHKTATATASDARAAIHSAMLKAQQLADARGVAMLVWLHVGDYGHPSGDIEARGTLSIQRVTTPDRGPEWAMVGIAYPGIVNGIVVDASYWLAIDAVRVRAQKGGL